MKRRSTGFSRFSLQLAWRFAASISYGMFALIKWIERGGTLDQSTELTPALGGYTGFSWHATAGIFVLPVISLLFLISSFFAKVPGGIKWALIVFGVTVLQVALGLSPTRLPGWGGYTASTPSRSSGLR